MALATNRGKNHPQSGETVNVPTGIYTSTNFYIRQTRQYIPSRQLRVFINFRWFLWIMTAVLCTQFTILFVVSVILGQVEPTFGISMACSVFSIVTTLSLIPAFIVYCQHLHVVCWTIPWVLRQPARPNMTTGYSHEEKAIDSLEGVYLSAYNCGIGVVSQKTGMVKFHVLNADAALQIMRARYASICLAVTTFVFIILWAPPVCFVSLIRVITPN